jgi:hypothetical protein
MYLSLLNLWMQLHQWNPKKKERVSYIGSIGMRTFWGTLWERVELASCACLRCCCTVAAGHARERERERTRERRKIERDLQKFVALPYSYSHCLFTIKLITSLRQVFFLCCKIEEDEEDEEEGRDRLSCFEALGGRGSLFLQPW